ALTPAVNRARQLIRAVKILVRDGRIRSRSVGSPQNASTPAPTRPVPRAIPRPRARGAACRSRGRRCRLTPLDGAPRRSHNRTEERTMIYLAGIPVTERLAPAPPRTLPAPPL